MENHNGEKLVSFNLERIKYWMAKKARVSNPVAELLGVYIITYAFNMYDLVIVLKCNTCLFFKSCILTLLVYKCNSNEKRLCNYEYSFKFVQWNLDKSK